MNSIRIYFLVLLMTALAACGRPLPFPTPAQQDLVVVIAEGPLSYTLGEAGTREGLEHDLIEAFAEELGVGVQFRKVPADQLIGQVNAGKAHLAAGWLSAPADGSTTSTTPLYLSRDVIIQHDLSTPLEHIDELAGKTIHVIPGSRQQETMEKRQRDLPTLKVVETQSTDITELVNQVSERKITYLALDSLLADAVLQYAPTVQSSLALGNETSIVWWLGKQPNEELANRINQFIERAQRDGTLARIEDRYLGHVRRLTQADILKFLGKVSTELPRYRKHFQAAEALTGVDWRLIAAVAYHESKWDPTATSPTGVRGIMMLTEETADKLGVRNRLDPAESIRAGAHYITLLKGFLPDTVAEPDRTWLALASYNLGPGNFNAGRTLARQLKADPDSWYEMKRILPLLAQPKYAQQLKTGRARGGEAVILVENIRSYYNILLRHQPSRLPEMNQASPSLRTGGLGLKLKH